MATDNRFQVTPKTALGKSWSDTLVKLITTERHDETDPKLEGHSVANPHHQAQNREMTSIVILHGSIIWLRGKH